MQRFHAGKETIIFQHIPKTAGTTLAFIIIRYFEKRDIYHIRNLQQMKGPAYSSHFGSLDDFGNLHPDERNRFHCIMGHMPFGIHRHLNHSFRYITFIRDPVRRVISQFGQHQRMVKKGDLEDDRLNLEEFLTLQPRAVNNHQTRFLSGWDLESRSPEACYEKALANIEKYYSLVGVVERFDESLLLLSKMFDWPNVAYIKRNIGTQQPSVGDIDPAIIERIRKANQLDARIHRHVVGLLDKHLRAQGEGFSQDLKIFRRKQALIERLHFISAPIRKLLRRFIYAGRALNQ